MVLDHVIEGGAASINLQKLFSTLLHRTVKSNFGQKIRLDDFKKTDRSGNGRCSLDDLQTFLLYQLERSYGQTESQHLIQTYHLCSKMAFDKAKAWDTSRLDNYITIYEYRSFLIYFLAMATMMDSWLHLCTSEDGERQILDEDHFIQHYELVCKGYGLALLDENDAKSLYSLVNIEDKHIMTLELWIESCIQAEIHSGTELGILFQAKPKPPTSDHSIAPTLRKRSFSVSSKMTAEKQREAIIDGSTLSTGKSVDHNSSENDYLTSYTDPRPVGLERLIICESPSIMETKSTSPSSRGTKRQSPLKSPAHSPIHGSNMSTFSSVGVTASRDLKDFLSALKPYTEKTLEGQKLRVIAFNSADSNGYGYCSFSEMNLLLLELLKKTIIGERADKIHHSFRWTYLRAYDRAKPLDRVGDLDYIMFVEFRVFIAFICIYAKMLEVFQKAMSDKGYDLEAILHKTTFVKRYQKLHNYGFIALDKIGSEEDASAAFDIFDMNGTGNLGFADFVSSLEKAEITMNTDLGVFFDTTKQQQLQTEKTAILSLSISQSKSMSPRNSASSSPIKISSIFTLGGAASNELKDFVSPFIPFTEKTIEGQKLRVTEFKEMDVHNTGRCSTVELENFVRLVLERCFDPPRAEYLFLFFRPSYQRAYSKATALDRSAKHDLIQVSEFRVYNAYLCIFSAMYDAFFKLCAGDDTVKNVSLNDFVDRYQSIRGYGFVALDHIRTKVEARTLYELMDDKRSDTIGFDEFCSVLEEAEISNETSFGDFLGGMIKSTPTFSPPPRLMMRSK
jgi:Ca2+-binding EF-hand superfamily protein